MTFESAASAFGRQALSGVVVAAVHWIAIAWVIQEPAIPEEESQTGGAFVIELAAVTASPDEERRDIAVGENSEEVAPVVASAAKQAAAAAPEKVDDDPPVPEVNQSPPEDAVPKPPEKVVKETEPEQHQAQARKAASVAPVSASEAAAPERIENADKVSDKPTGQNEGLSRIDRRAIANWQRDLVVHLSRYKRYPLKARQARQHGVVNIAFTMNREGRILHATVARSSGHEPLDRAAIELLSKASPLPLPPESMPGSTIELIVPVNYRWRD